jgi:hypothetical protein
MKIINFLSILSLIIHIEMTSCDNDDKNEYNKLSFNEFCSIIPDGWNCEIIVSDFNIHDIPHSADTPLAIIKYINPNKEFTRYDNRKQHPSLILNFYDIKEKEELIEFIESQRIYSWCIPWYYGETKDYYIITSPCFINGGCFTEECNNCLKELHASLKKIIIINSTFIY